MQFFFQNISFHLVGWCFVALFKYLLSCLPFIAANMIGVFPFSPGRFTFAFPRMSESTILWFPKWKRSVDVNVISRSWWISGDVLFSYHFLLPLLMAYYFSNLQHSHLLLPESTSPLFFRALIQRQNAIFFNETNKANQHKSIWF